LLIRRDKNDDGARCDKRAASDKIARSVIAIRFQPSAISTWVHLVSLSLPPRRLMFINSLCWLTLSQSEKVATLTNEMMCAILLIILWEKGFLHQITGAFNYFYGRIIFIYI